MLTLSRPRTSHDSWSRRRFGSQRRDLPSGCHQDQVAGSEVFTGTEGLRRSYRSVFALSSFTFALFSLTFPREIYVFTRHLNSDRYRQIGLEVLWLEGFLSRARSHNARLPADMGH